MEPCAALRRRCQCPKRTACFQGLRGMQPLQGEATGRVCQHLHACGRNGIQHGCHNLESEDPNMQGGLMGPSMKITNTAHGGL